MHYDLGLLGNHEFDHGYEQIDRFLEIANFLISANAFNPEGELIADEPFLIKQIGEIALGLWLNNARHTENHDARGQ